MTARNRALRGRPSRGQRCSRGRAPGGGQGPHRTPPALPRPPNSPVPLNQPVRRAGGSGPAAAGRSAPGPALPWRRWGLSRDPPGLAGRGPSPCPRGFLRGFTGRGEQNRSHFPTLRGNPERIRAPRPGAGVPCPADRLPAILPRGEVGTGQGGERPAVPKRIRPKRGQIQVGKAGFPTGKIKA